MKTLFIYFWLLYIIFCIKDIEKFYFDTNISLVVIILFLWVWKLLDVSEYISKK